MAEAEHLKEQEQAAARRSEAVQAAAGRDEAVRHRAYRTLEEVAVAVRAREQRPPQKAAIPDVEFIPEMHSSFKSSSTSSIMHMASAVIPENCHAKFMGNEAEAALAGGSPIPSIRASTRLRAGSDEFILPNSSTADSPSCRRSRAPTHMRPAAGRVHATSLTSPVAHDGTRSTSAEARLWPMRTTAGHEEAISPSPLAHGGPRSTSAAPRVGGRPQ